MFSRKIRIMATAGVVCLVGGIGAGAGVLIYQSRKTQSIVTEQNALDMTALQRLFPKASSLVHYPFLNYVQPKQLNLGAIADLNAYAADKSKLFAKDSLAVARLIFDNALANSSYWSERAKYLNNPAAYQQAVIAETISSSELRVAVGVADAQGKTWYDVGTVGL